jgi:hypothetical protein
MGEAQWCRGKTGGASKKAKAACEDSREVATPKRFSAIFVVGVTEVSFWHNALRVEWALALRYTVRTVALPHTGSRSDIIAYPIKLKISPK